MLKRFLTCLLVEDEQACIDMMVSTVRDFFPELNLIVSRNLDQARELYGIHHPELLILDVNLPDGRSVDWLREFFEESQQMAIIFTTAYANYAVEAFRFSALDYLLKPLLPEELVQAIHKAVKTIGNRDLQQQLETFFHNYHQEQTLDKRIILRTVEEIRVVNLGDVLAVEADNSYSKFHLKGGENIWVAQSIKSFDQQLSSSGFMRVHQSYLVHLRYVVSFKKKTNTLLLDEGLSFPVSLQKKASILAYLHKLT